MGLTVEQLCVILQGFAGGAAGGLSVGGIGKLAEAQQRKVMERTVEGTMERKTSLKRDVVKVETDRFPNR